MSSNSTQRIYQLRTDFERLLALVSGAEAQTAAM